MADANGYNPRNISLKKLIQSSHLLLKMQKYVMEMKESKISN